MSSWTKRQRVLGSRAYSLFTLILMAGSPFTLGCNNRAEGICDGDADVGGDTGIDEGPGACIRSPDCSVALVTTGRYHTCALLDTGDLWCWGRNCDGQLGDGATAQARTSAVCVQGLQDVTDIGLGETHSCALTVGNEVWCWGDNQFGQLGTGDFVDNLIPAVVIGLPVGQIAQLVSGHDHSCVRLQVGDVWCWGSNLDGQLGAGDFGAGPAPVRVIDIPNAAEVQAAGHHMLARTVDGRFFVWGDNAYGQLGDGTRTDQPGPVELQVPAGVTFVEPARAGHHSCARTSDGRAFCWGRNNRGQVDGTGADVLAPTEIAGLPFVIDIAAGHEHTCILAQTQEVWCWGDNSFGQLGDGTFSGRATPNRVTDLVNMTTLGNASDHTCGTDGDGQIVCWGQNVYGQVGDGTQQNVPLPVFVF